MRKYVLAVFLVWMAGTAEISAQLPDINSVRDDFFRMSESKIAALTLYNKLKDCNLNGKPELMAYRGAASAAAAGSVDGVRDKLKYFSNGKDELELSVKLAPVNAEVRFLRFATQMNAPAFLGYRSNLKDDRRMIVKFLSESRNMDVKLYIRIAEYLVSGGDLTPTELVLVNRFLDQNKSK